MVYKMDEKDREPTPNMVKDIISMAQHELHRTIDDEKAMCVARKILSKAKERDDLYRVPTIKLNKLIDEC